MEYIYFSYFKNIYSQNFTSLTEATTASSSADISPTYITIIIAASTVILAVTLLILIFLFVKKLHTTCCQAEPELGNYDIVTVDENLCNGSGYYNRQSELNPIVDINTSTSENTSLWYDSEYDNLSLSPEVTDGDIVDLPPDYEHPPAYESATRRQSRILGNYEDV